MIAAGIDLERTRAECAARETRVDAMFDSLDADFARIFGKFQDTGVIRDASARTRAGDQDGAQ